MPNPLIDRIFIKPPDSSNANGRDPALDGVLADGDFMELEVLGDFFGGHDLGHSAWPPVYGRFGNALIN